MDWNDGIDVDSAATAIECAVTTEHGIEPCAARVSHLFVVVKPHRFTIVDPLKRHPGNISPQDLL